MTFRLKTVRGKLTALVALSIAVMVATLPVLSWLLRKQLVDQVADRLVSAEKSFAEEFNDDLADLAIAAKIIAADSDTVRALGAGDPKAAQKLAEAFVGAYPEMDVLLVDARGSLLAQVGCATPLTDIAKHPDLAPVLRRGEVRSLTSHGCEASPGAPPAYVIALPIKDHGAVVTCLPLNAPHLANAARKLGLELALIGPDSSVLERTSRFPTSIDAGAVGPQSSLVDAGGVVFATARFQPPELRRADGGFALLAALDVTDIRKLVLHHLYFVLAVLAFAGSLSVAFGARLARIMSDALNRVNAALKELEQQKYVHIDALRTGDELEDLATGFNTMVDGLKERDKLRSTFGKYMTASVMAHLMSGKVQLGGETLAVTILFTDIRSFTSISERMDAHSLVRLLNEYFTEMVGIVTQEDGVVDKYIGDAIMAVFGAPVSKHDDAIRAVRAAVRMRTALAHLNTRLVARGLSPLQTGIGIHTGEVVAGNIGSETRMEYTVIGDAVNLASRLESNTKTLGVNVLISEDTYELAKEHIVARKMMEITVKGRSAPVMTYEVLGLKDEPLLEEGETSSGQDAVAAGA